MKTSQQRENEKITLRETAFIRIIMNKYTNKQIDKKANITEIRPSTFVVYFTEQTLDIYLPPTGPRYI